VAFVGTDLEDNFNPVVPDQCGTSNTALAAPGAASPQNRLRIRLAMLSPARESRGVNDKRCVSVTRCRRRRPPRNEKWLFDSLDSTIWPPASTMNSIWCVAEGSSSRYYRGTCICGDVYWVWNPIGSRAMACRSIGTPDSLTVGGTTKLLTCEIILSPRYNVTARSISNGPSLNCLHPVVPVAEIVPDRS
jgi:hypothetical protein